MIYCFFFFKQNTAYDMLISDWSSDVCSADLDADHDLRRAVRLAARLETRPDCRGARPAPQYFHRRWLAPHHPAGDHARPVEMRPDHPPRPRHHADRKSVV